MAEFSGVVVDGNVALDQRQFDTSGATPQPGGLRHEVNPVLHGVFHDQQPKHPIGFAYAGVPHPGFGEVWFDTIHVLPRLINDMGVTVPGQTQSFTVWSSYIRPYELNEVLGEGTTGLTLLEPEASPTVFAPLELRTYVVVVNEDSGDVISVDYTFTFFDSQFTIRFFGDRSNVMPFPPHWGLNAGVKDTFQWLTDVRESRNGIEQRARLRESPVRHFSYNTLVHGDALRHMNSLLHGRHGRFFSVPVWQDGTQLTEPAAAGDTALQVDTTGRDFYAGGTALLWRDWNWFETASIVSVSPSGIDLQLELAQDHPKGALVFPLRAGKLVEGTRAERLTSGVSQVGLAFRIEDLNISIPAADSGPLHYGTPVLLQEPNRVNTLGDTYSSKIEVFDPETTRTFYDLLSDTPRLISSFEWMLQNWVRIGDLRGWFQARAGRWKSVWVPSWTVDLVLAKPVLAGTLSLPTIDTNHRRYLRMREGRRDLFILMRNGDVFTRRIEDVVLDLDLNESFTLDASLPYDVAPEDIRIICYLGLCRIADDNCEWDWPTPGVALIKTNFRLLKE